MSEEKIGRAMGKATLIMISSIFLSRVMGFVREIVIATTIGANARTDVYFAAFTLPDFLNHLLAGGALSIAFIPVFTRYLAKDDEAEGWRVFSVVITAITVFGLPLIFLGMIFAPQLVPLIAPGFDAEKVAATAHLVRIIFPAQYFFLIGGVLMATQYAKGRFLLPAMAPIVYNLGIILGGLILGPYLGMEGFAWGVLLGAVGGNFLIQLIGARRQKMVYRPTLSLRHPGFKEFLLLSIPIMFGFSLVLVDEWIIKAFASSLAVASISWLNYGRVIMRIPMAVFGQAAGVASFPFLSRLAAEGDLPGMARAMVKAIRRVLFLIVPAAALTIIASREIVCILFKRGKFTVEDAAGTASTVLFFGFGIIAWGMYAILSRTFYAMRDTLTPTLIGTLFTALGIPLAWLFVGYMKHNGLALASSIGITLFTLTLYLLLLRRLRRKWGLKAVQAARGVGSSLIRVLAAAIPAALAAWGGLKALDSVLPWTSFSGSVARLAIASVVLGVLYLVLSKLLRIEEMEAFWSRVTARFKGRKQE